MIISTIIYFSIYSASIRQSRSGKVTLALQACCSTLATGIIAYRYLLTSPFVQG